MGSRIAMGLIFFVFGVNGLFHFFPTPSAQLEAEVFPAGYFFVFVKTVETACGLLFLVNRFVPLATVVIAPVVVNILLFHVFLDVSGLPVAIFLLALNVVLGVAYWDSFAALLKPHVAPTV